MTSSAQIVEEARSWVGVPTFHHGRTRAGGVDCLGLVMAVGEATGAIARAGIVVPDYGRLPNPKRLVAGMGAAGMIKIAAFDDGDVIGISWGLAGRPMHLAIAATYRDRKTIIHADPRAGSVREVSFAGVWAAGFAGCPAWRFPNVGV